MSKKEKTGVLSRVLAELDKVFGKGTIMKLGDERAPEIGVIPTGSVGLDLALGIGGLPRGRVIEIYGPESSGKTTLTLHAIASVQRLGGVAAFIDAEHALDVRYAAALGVDVANLLIAQPDSGEQALEIVDRLAGADGVDLIVVDSVAALVPQAEIDGEMGDSHVGLQARLMGQALRKLGAATHRNGVSVLFVNQLRTKVGVLFGSPETTTGGNALKFYASVRLDIRRTGRILQGEQVIGSRTRVTVAKNKLAPPFRKAEFDILYGRGISRAGELLDMGVALDIVEKSGAWLSFEGERWQGKEAARKALEEQPALAERLEKVIRERQPEMAGDVGELTGDAEPGSAAIEAAA